MNKIDWIYDAITGAGGAAFGYFLIWIHRGFIKRAEQKKTRDAFRETSSQLDSSGNKKTPEVYSRYHDHFLEI